MGQGTRDKGYFSTFYYMFRSPLTYIAVLFCIIFSCTSDIEMPPPPLDDPSSSSSENPPMSQPNEQNSSSSKLGSIDESSSSLAITPSSQSTTQSSSSSIAGSNLNSSSSSTQGGQSSSSLSQSNNEPRLEGTCKWDNNPTAAATGATASGVTLNDPSGICGATKPPVKYYQESGTEWQQGKAVAVGKYKVHATVDCPAYPSIGKVDCPELEVKDVMYQFKKPNENITFMGPAPIIVAIKMSLPIYWHSNTTGNATFQCHVSRGSNGDGKISGTVDGISFGDGYNDNTDFVTTQIPVTSTINDYSLEVKITTLGGTSAECEIAW